MLRESSDEEAHARELCGIPRTIISEAYIVAEIMDKPYILFYVSPSRRVASGLLFKAELPVLGESRENFRANYIGLVIIGEPNKVAATSITINEILYSSLGKKLYVIVLNRSLKESCEYIHKLYKTVGNRSSRIYWYYLLLENIEEIVEKVETILSTT